ncbi:MAG TPA: adhesin [Providencia sp.]|uniref:adhesin n=1 Tax=Providencia sp. TaxID=589 RepID=UPI000E9CE9C2|nr:adhesin [Providencia sp.]MBP6081016.1 adhesin [Providencia sp.]HBO24297.1 adhesin [Providencia sp.]
MKKVKITPLISILILLFFYSNLSHALTRYTNTGGSYIINLSSYNAKINNSLITGSNGEKYYSITPPNQEGIIVNENTSQATGTVNCRTDYVLGPGYLDAKYAYHRIFSYIPKAGFTINGYDVYKINSNTYVTMYSSKSLTTQWVNIPSIGCSISNTGPLDPSNFKTLFPFEIRVFVKTIPIDGKIIIPQATIAGYSVMFQDTYKPNMSPISENSATIKIELTSSMINFPSDCKSSIDNLNIDHKILDAAEFGSKAIRTITYQCNNDKAVKAKFSLDYATDNDPQKRVPLKSGSNTIYSELTLYDAESNQRGKSFVANINKIKTIQIESRISGSNAKPGKYKGNAWLIATYL